MMYDAPVCLITYYLHPQYILDYFPFNPYFNLANLVTYLGKLLIDFRDAFWLSEATLNINITIVITWNIGLRCGHASEFPPGIKEGP